MLSSLVLLLCEWMSESLCFSGKRGLDSQRVWQSAIKFLNWLLVTFIQITSLVGAPAPAGVWHQLMEPLQSLALPADVVSSGAGTTSILMAGVLPRAAACNLCARVTVSGRSGSLGTEGTSRGGKKADQVQTSLTAPKDRSQQPELLWKRDGLAGVVYGNISATHLIIFYKLAHVTSTQNA